MPSNPDARATLQAIANQCAEDLRQANEHIKEEDVIYQALLTAWAAATARAGERITELEQEVTRLRPHTHNIQRQTCGCCASCICGYGYGGSHASLRQAGA